MEETKRKLKCKLAIEKGFIYDSNTGKVFSKFGKEITGNQYGYIYINIIDNNKSYQLRAHQFAWYITYGEVVDCIDHINGIRNDNRISNLRSVTHQQNTFNTKAKGYSWNKSKNKWTAQIMLNSKNINLGSFDNEYEARQAYLDAKITHHNIN